MLRITNWSTPRSQILKLEGTLRGPWVAELRRVWSASLDDVPINRTIDVSFVTFVDDEGRGLLIEMREAGAALEGMSPFLRQVLDGNDTTNQADGRRRI